MTKMQLRLIRLLGLAICGGTFAAICTFGRHSPSSSVEEFSSRMFSPLTIAFAIGIGLGCFLIALSFMITKEDRENRNIETHGNNR